MTAMQQNTTIVLTATPNQVDALTTESNLVQKKFAARMELMLAMTSLYQWDNPIRHGSEQLLMINSIQPQHVKLESILPGHQPYELPEIIATPITHELYFERL